MLDTVAIMIRALLFILVFLVGTTLSKNCLADENQVYALMMANYFVAFRHGEEVREMKGQAKVRSTQQFELTFDDYRILVLVIRSSEAGYEADVVIQEKAGSDWLAIHNNPISMRAQFEAPSELQWSSGEYSLELAIAVAVIEE